MEKNSNLTGHLAALFTVFIWSITFISIKILLKSFTPVETIFFRLVIAYGALFIASPKLIPVGNLKEELLLAAAGFCGVTLYLVFQNIALSYTLASNVSVLISISPFFTGLISTFLLKDKSLDRYFYVGFLISIIGIALISFNGNFLLKLNPLGDMLAIACALVWSIYTVLLKQLSHSNLTTIQVNRKIFLYGLLLYLPFMGIFGFNPNLSLLLTLPNIINTLALGLFASAICFVTWNYAIKKLGMVPTSVYLYLIPVITIIFSSIFLKEKITPVSLLGVALILTGLFISESKKRISRDPQTS